MAANSTSASGCIVVLADGSSCPETPKVGRYCAQHAMVAECDMEVYRLLREHYMQDLRLFWQRSNFYLVVDGALVSVFASGKEPAFRVVLAVFGLVISAFWYLVARGSIIWLHRWRHAIISLDSLVDRLATFARAETNVFTRPWESPSWITKWLPVAFGIGWVVLLMLSLTQGGSL